MEVPFKESYPKIIVDRLVKPTRNTRKTTTTTNTNKRIYTTTEGPTVLLVEVGLGGVDCFCQRE